MGLGSRFRMIVILHGCRYMVYTLALRGLLSHDFGAYVRTVMVLGPFGKWSWLLLNKFLAFSCWGIYTVSILVELKGSLKQCGQKEP